jgi:hypothetical protein
VEFNCLLIKVDWLAACIALRVVGAVLVVFLGHNPQASGKQVPIPEEMLQTLPSNKKQGTLDYVHADNIIKRT